MEGGRLVPSGTLSCRLPLRGRHAKGHIAASGPSADAGSALARSRPGAGNHPDLGSGHSGNGTGRCDYHPWSNTDRFNYATYNLVLTPSTRTGVFGRVEHETAAGTRLQLRAFFNRRESVHQAAPEPVWAGTLGETGSLMDDIVIDADNPYNPFGFDVGPGGFLTRRPLESGPRIFEQDIDTRYAAFTMEGVSRGFGRAWLWDASLVWSNDP